MSIPNNWGDWRPNLTPHTGNLQATDLIECTMIVGGLPVNTAITGAQIIAAASGGSIAWGAITGTLSAQTDLQTALNGKLNVPTGTTADYIDGTGGLQVFPTLTSADKMVTVGRNSTGSTLYAGTIIYISGSTGNRPNYVKAQANSEATSAGTFGVIQADIPNNSDGNAVTIGTLSNLDTRSVATHPFTTDTLVDGDTIYLSPTTAGYVTRVKPSAPNHLVYIGKVVRTSPTNGTIVYRIQNGYELDEIHDVAISSVANNDILQYDSAASLWKNRAISSGVTVGTTAIASGTIGGILFQNGSNLLAQDAALFWDNTNKRLGLGATPASTVRLDVRAQGALSTDLAFRVRNSANTLDIIRANGLGEVYIGIGAGSVNTATQNTFIGLNAGLSNTTGAQNTVNGHHSFRTNSTGQSNTSVGAYALFSNTTGNNNIGIGYASLYLNSTGASSTAIGHSALYANTTGGNNSAVGFYALQNNTTATHNAAIGFYALQSNTTGQSNSAIGASSLQNNTTGGSNAAVGYASGAYITGGVTANAITTNSVYIGNNTKALANNQTNQIVIGDNATGAGSNTVTLGHTTIVKTILRGTLNAANLPTSPTGLVTGDIWNNLGILTIV
jgi:hypothetical protein